MRKPFRLRSRNENVTKGSGTRAGTFFIYGIGGRGRHSVRRVPANVAKCSLGILYAIIPVAAGMFLFPVEFNNLLQCHFAQGVPEFRIEIPPYFPCGANAFSAALFRPADAIDDRQGVFHHFDDLEQGDVPGRFRQLESALRPPYRLHHSGPAQIDNQAAEVFFGYLLRLGNIPDQAEFVSRMQGRINNMRNP